MDFKFGSRESALSIVTSNESKYERNWSLIRTACMLISISILMLAFSKDKAYKIREHKKESLIMILFVGYWPISYAVTFLISCLYFTFMCFRGRRREASSAAMLATYSRLNCIIEILIHGITLIMSVNSIYKKSLAQYIYHHRVLIWIAFCSLAFILENFVWFFLQELSKEDEVPEEALPETQARRNDIHLLFNQMVDCKSFESDDPLSIAAFSELSRKRSTKANKTPSRDEEPFGSASKRSIAKEPGSKGL